MKLLSLFSGIGAFEKALDNLEIPYDLVAYCEIDKYASKSYSAIHGVPESMNLGDITKVDEKALPKDIDLVTYGFPCQDISLSGKMKGLFNEDVLKILKDMGFDDLEIADLAKWIGKGEHTDDEIRNYLFNEHSLNRCECDVLIEKGINESTRSGLFFQALRIIEETQPKVAIAENVKNLTSKKFAEQFRIVLGALESAGYHNYWEVLNAKDFGIPQNRERVFIVSIRKDIDTGMFRFPKGFPLKLWLKDFLEETVDSRFYIETPFNEYPDHTCRTIKNQYQKNSTANFMITTARGATGVQILVREATKKGYAEAVEGDSINLEQPNSKTRRGRVGHQVAQTLTTSPKQVVVVNE